MSISTFSLFYYGYEITRDENKINFSEGGGELTATISIGRYSATTLQTAIKTAMDGAGALTYTVVFDRDSRKYTISSTSNFELLIGTGTQRGLSPFSLLGFSGSVDLTGALTYTSDSVSGDVYEPQFILQDYVDPEHMKEKIDATVHESANGNIETVSFGTRRFVEMNMMFINNYVQDGKVIKNNASGVADCVRFLENLITKGDVEFMPNINSRSNFLTLKIETLQGSSNGTGYLLKEELGKNLPGYYQTGKMKFRVTE
jgi:hypothetical protein